MMIKLNGTWTNDNDEKVLDVLHRLPLVSAIGDGSHAIDIELERPLTASEAFLLGTLDSTQTEIDDDQTKFYIWFD